MAERRSGVRGARSRLAYARFTEGALCPTSATAPNGAGSPSALTQLDDESAAFDDGSSALESVCGFLSLQYAHKALALQSDHQQQKIAALEQQVADLDRAAKQSHITLEALQTGLHAARDVITGISKQLMEVRAAASTPPQSQAAARAQQHQSGAARNAASQKTATVPSKALVSSRTLTPAKRSNASLTL
jgi:hypothetical protein